MMTKVFAGLVGVFLTGSLMGGTLIGDAEKGEGLPGPLAGTPSVSPKLDVQFQQQVLPGKGILYTVWVPEGVALHPVVSQKLKYLDGFLDPKTPKDRQIVINGGYFDPQNGETTSFIVENGQLVADPNHNRRLMDNPALEPYLPKIMNRTEFRVYQCKDGLRYDIVTHQETPPDGCELESALGGGPALLPAYTAQEEGFVDFNEQGKLTRDPIGSIRSNARSAVGMTEEGKLLIVMVAQNPEEKGAKGVSLPELAELMKTLGVTKAMGFDGGSSSGIWVLGEPYYGKFEQDGQPVRRKVKSVLRVLL